MLAILLVKEWLPLRGQVFKSLPFALLVVSSDVIGDPIALGQLPPPPTGVPVSAEAGFEFATVGARGNAAWPGTPNDLFAGRGSVSYDYRISRLEITTDQWMEFVNAFGPLGDPYNFRTARGSGFRLNAFYPGPGFQVEYQPGISNPGMQPVLGISWRNAARYCNWLHNGKQAVFAALENGAYNTSTWGVDPISGYLTDAITHETGARYWIPTLDEWLKAAYFDPSRYALGVSGWWEYPNRSAVPLIAGLPGIGQTSGGLHVLSPFGLVPLLAYPTEMSPWGLFDTSGGASELTEEPLFPTAFFRRNAMGADELSALAYLLDPIGSYTAEGAFTGLRIATSVPNPTASFALPLGLFFLQRRRRP